MCVLFDEAHKALGNHTYCQVRLSKCNLTTKVSVCVVFYVIKGLAAISNQYRVLALTATLGDD